MASRPVLLPWAHLVSAGDSWELFERDAAISKGSCGPLMADVGWLLEGTPLVKGQEASTC